MCAALTLIFIPNALETKLSGIKKNANCVSLEMDSASRIALSLSTMFMLDIKAWKVVSIRRDVFLMSRCISFSADFNFPS